MCKTAVIISLSLLFFVTDAFSDVYKYTDENGVVCYTDTPLGKKADLIYRDSANKEKSSEKTGLSGYSTYVKKAASKYQIEPELIHAVIKTESNGNHRAVSNKGAMGLMQLMPSTASDMAVSNPFSPEQNIEGGTKYLRYLLEKFNGDLTLALAAYNAGPTTVEKYGNVPPFPETRNYVNKVYSQYRGKRKVAVSAPASEVKSAPIYKIVMEDGTILFTNASLPENGKVRF